MKNKTETPSAKEPVAAYASLVYNPMSVIFGAGYANATDFDLLVLARKGISKKALTTLAKQIALTLEEIAKVLHISERTLQRYEPTTLVKTEYADRAIELARLYERGIDVLGSQEAFNSWLKTPNYALGNEIPLHLLDTHIGFTMVFDVLGRIEHGIFS
ncbi:putative toxin-antitoxin system antitoxin component (TIGR02293 family) [Pedobacter sp. UYP30]|uniref:type II RES/Xre toxin-antitoxin system antitoxin n=1 Tax=Pedobacter sp. UYP30 TaxID=1756400 RepID=UPI003393141D